jgi:dTDP-4-amino-4,6-dideoxygalactose transaminase
MSVPLLDLSRHHDSLRPEMEAALRRVLDSGQFILGPEVEALEEEVAQACGASRAVAVASGTDALYLSLRALGVGAGREVVTTPFTFISTATSILRAGARPVFADIEASTFNLDPEAAAAACGPRTGAILPVDLFGRCADWGRFERLASERNVALVEDAAQSFGARWEGRPAGSFGDATAISFYPTKNLGGMGDGGILTTRRPDVADKVALLRTHADAGGYRHEEIGVNSRLDAFQAAILRVKLGHVAAWNAERRRLAARYTRILAGIFPSSAQTREPAPLQLPAPDPPGGDHVHHLYVIRTKRRDEVAAYLRERGIGCGVYYPIPLHLQPCFADLGHERGAYPETERACAEVLALPIYPGLRESEQDEVCEALGSFHGVRS